MAESYYYLNGKFVERMDGDKRTRTYLAKEFNAKIVKIVPFTHNITGKGTKIYMTKLKTKKKK